jgi:hypothetical protein
MNGYIFIKGPVQMSAVMALSKIPGGIAAMGHGEVGWSDLPTHVRNRWTWRRYFFRKRITLSLVVTKEVTESAVDDDAPNYSRTSYWPRLMFASYMQDVDSCSNGVKDAPGVFPNVGPSEEQDRHRVGRKTLWRVRPGMENDTKVLPKKVLTAEWLHVEGRVP